MERAHEKLAVVAKRAADLTTRTRGRQAIRAAFNKVAAARNVAARRRNAAARIFDERTRHKVCAHSRRLHFLHILAVAVIHHDNAVRRTALCDLYNALDLLHCQGRAQAVPAGALNVHHAVLRRDGRLHAVIIRRAVRQQVKLLVVYAKLL